MSDLSPEEKLELAIMTLRSIEKASTIGNARRLVTDALKRLIPKPPLEFLEEGTPEWDKSALHTLYVHGNPITSCEDCGGAKFSGYICIRCEEHGE
ncbi:hypothetical protein HN682_02530 [Candidatus Peregrinibacteria bacterium]|jgi:hypothetical protein|nr:hypothetical protein [Candidatus Peregrinibacteria bacterium]